MKRLSFIILILLLFACGGEANLSDEGFRAIILSDVHISSDEAKEARLASLVENINSGQYGDVRFILINGDCVSRVYKDFTPEDPDSSENRVMKLADILGDLRVPHYLVMGNHDYKIGPGVDSDAWFSPETIGDMEARWKRWTGFDPYYSFDMNSWQFVVLNSMRGRPDWQHFDQGQLDWLESVLQQGRPTVLFSHFPLKTDHFRIWCKKKDLITPEKESRFYEILRKNRSNIKAIFTGHGHMWVTDTLLDSIRVFETDSFGDSKHIPFHFLGIDRTNLTVKKIVENWQ